MAVIALLFLLPVMSLCEIAITQGPENVTATVGGSATFPCRFTGTKREPVWYIRGLQLTQDNLPPRHYFLNGNVTIYNVQPSDNGSTYQCTFFTVSSEVATLTVLAPTDAPTEFTSPTLPAVQQPTSTLVFHETTTAALQSDPSSPPKTPTTATTTTTTATSANSVIVVDMKLLPLVSLCVLVIPGVIGAGCAVGIFKKNKRRKVVPSTVVYEDVGPRLEFVIKTNDCYEQQHIYCEIESVISVKENDAYATAAKVKKEPPSPQPSNTSSVQDQQNTSRNSTIHE